MDTLKDILVEVVQFLIFPILMVGFGILSAVVDPKGLSWFFAVLAIVALGIFVVKYWMLLYFGWLAILFLGAGLVTAGALTVVWEFITFDGNPDSVLRDWEGPFSFFFILYLVMWIAYAIILTEALDIVVKFVKGLFQD
jgi:hypothetical protein